MLLIRSGQPKLQDLADRRALEAQAQPALGGQDRGHHHQSRLQQDRIEHHPVIAEHQVERPDGDQRHQDRHGHGQDHRPIAHGPVHPVDIEMHKSVQKRGDGQNLVGPGDLGHAEELGNQPGAEEQNQRRQHRAGKLKALQRREPFRIVLLGLDHLLLQPEGRQHFHKTHHRGEGGRDAVILDRDQPCDQQVAQQRQ
jgi:hypothetical protein